MTWASSSFRHPPRPGFGETSGEDVTGAWRCPGRTRAPPHRWLTSRDGSGSIIGDGAAHFSVKQNKLGRLHARGRLRRRRGVGRAPQRYSTPQRLVLPLHIAVLPLRRCLTAAPLPTLPHTPQGPEDERMSSGLFLSLALIARPSSRRFITRLPAALTTSPFARPSPRSEKVRNRARKKTQNCAFARLMAAKNRALLRLYFFRERFFLFGRFCR